MTTAIIFIALALVFSMGRILLEKWWANLDASGEERHLGDLAFARGAAYSPFSKRPGPYGIFLDPRSRPTLKIKCAVMNCRATCMNTCSKRIHPGTRPTSNCSTPADARPIYVKGRKADQIPHEGLPDERGLAIFRSAPRLSSSLRQGYGTIKR